MSLAEKFNTLLNNIRRNEPSYSRIAVVGQPGAGKSTLINRLVGDEVADSGTVTDTTQKATEYNFPQIFQKLIDTPGYDTEMFTFDKWKEKFSPQQYDVFILVFKGKLHESDEKLFSELKNWNRDRNRPLFIVRNFSDGLSENEKNTIRNDIKNIGFVNENIYFTDCGRYEFGINELTNAIAKTDFKKVWRDRIISKFKQEQDNYLRNANSHAKSEIDSGSMVAGANGLNPIPGVDVAADLAIYYNIFGDIRRCYDISEGDATLYTLPVAKKLLELATKEGVSILLKKFAGRVAVKSVAKYIPIFGQMVSAGIGYKMASYAGEEYNDYCYRFAEEVMDKLIAEKIAKISAEVPILS